MAAPLLPKDKVRYLLGVGHPADILHAVACGIDMFDCVMPSRNARHGMLYTWEGTINIKNEKWELDFSPIQENSTVWVDRVYSKAYLRHLIKCQEILGFQIATIHNLSFYLELMAAVRKHIADGDFVEWKNSVVKKLSQRL
jgi:queuine tRNA-ribosyltransferase